MDIAIDAAQSEVAGERRPAMFLGDNMIHLERSFLGFLRDSTIFTTILSPLPDESSERQIYKPPKRLVLSGV